MTETLRAAIASTAAELRAVSDPVERHQATRQARRMLELGDATFRAVERDIALELRGPTEERTWDEVGRLMGGLTRQRAKQIAEGVGLEVHTPESTPSDVESP